MTEHPLTDEMCETLSRQTWLDPDVDVEGTAHDMRAAADWQLEQVVKALNQCKEEKRSCIEVIYLFHEKLEAMRPTTTQEEN
jgi:phosphoglycerate-specific signal transduction histidine kinase